MRRCVSTDPVERLRERVDLEVVRALALEYGHAVEPSQPEPDSEEVTSRILAAIVEETSVVEVLGDCASDLDNELRWRYGAGNAEGAGVHASQLGRFKRDMEPVLQARALVDTLLRASRTEAAPHAD